MITILAFSQLAFAADGAKQATEASTALGFPPITVGIFVIAFIVSVLIDLWQHKNSEEITLGNSIGWSIFWIALSLAFYGWLLVGPPELVLGSADPELVKQQGDFASKFLTGYVLEKVLSVDNLIVFIAIFKFFNIKDVLQHRILYYGILGAIIFRGIFVGIGSGLLTVAGPWAELIFGLLVGYAAIMMLGDDDDDEEEPDYESMWLVKQFQKFYPIFPHLVGKSFFVNRQEAAAIADKDPSITLKEGVKKWMTPAFVCLLVIEGSDVMFAFDSVPAVIAVTKEPLLVYAAMIFAILGLRSLYFVLVVLTKYMSHIETAVIYVLFFIAAKMFIHAYDGFSQDYGLPPEPEWLHISPNMSMGIVLTMLSLGVIASLIWPNTDEDEDDDNEGEEQEASAE